MENYRINSRIFYSQNDEGGSTYKSVEKEPVNQNIHSSYVSTMDIPTVLGRTTSAKWSRKSMETAIAAVERGKRMIRRFVGGCEPPVFTKPKE